MCFRLSAQLRVNRKQCLAFPVASTLRLQEYKPFLHTWLPVKLDVKWDGQPMEVRYVLGGPTLRLSRATRPTLFSKPEEEESSSCVLFLSIHLVSRFLLTIIIINAPRSPLPSAKSVAAKRLRRAWCRWPAPEMRSWSARWSPC